MSIGGEIKHAVHHAAHKVEHAAKDAAHKVKEGVEDTADKAKDTAEDAVDQASQIGDVLQDAIDQIKDAVQDGLNQLKHEADRDKTSILHMGTTIEKSLKNAERSAISAIEAKVIAPAIHELTKDAQAAYHGVQQAIAKGEKIPGQLMHKVLTELTTNALNKALDVLELALPDELFIQISALQLFFNNLDGKVAQIRKWVRSKPDFSSRKGIFDLIKLLTPYSVALDYQGEASLLIVTSKDFSAEITAKYDIDEDLDVLDDLIRQW